LVLVGLYAATEIGAEENTKRKLSLTRSDSADRYDLSLSRCEGKVAADSSQEIDQQVA
jgi:hypothetical protein